MQTCLRLTQSSVCAWSKSQRVDQKSACTSQHLLGSTRPLPANCQLGWVRILPATCIITQGRSIFRLHMAKCCKVNLNQFSEVAGPYASCRTFSADRLRFWCPAPTPCLPQPPPPPQNLYQVPHVLQVRELEDLMANEAAWEALPKREQQEKESVLRQESELPAHPGGVVALGA